MAPICMYHDMNRSFQLWLYENYKKSLLHVFILHPFIVPIIQKKLAPLLKSRLFRSLINERILKKQ